MVNKYSIAYSKMSITRTGGTSRYSDIVCYNGVAYLSGIVPSVAASLYVQTKEVLSLLDAQIRLIGSTNNDILSLTIYLTDATMYDEMNRAYDEWIGPVAPARATIGVVGFPNPMWKIEIVATVKSNKSLYTKPIYNDVNYVR